MMPGNTRRGRRGQAVVEMALMSLVLAMLLAGAVDFGRAYYTAVVVTNMAGEGASYAAIFPDHDLNYQAPGTCSKEGVDPTKDQNIQARARKVAADRGLVIRQPTAAQIQIAPADCSTRCVGQPITVTVTYPISDLFLPKLIGTSSIIIRKSSSQQIARNSYLGSQPGGPCTISP